MQQTQPTGTPTPSITPLSFATDTLKIIGWPKLNELFEAVERGERKILVRSCNGAGKTTALAALCLWKLKQHEDAIVLTTASSWTQVSRSLWGEIRRLARASGLFTDREISSTQIKLDDKHYAIGISPTLPENAQGFHAPHMLIAIDEATGVDREIIDALWGNATNKDAQMILIYNPINESSFPFEAEETGDWCGISISAFEHPNVITGEEIIPGAVTREWIDDRLKAWSYEVESPIESDLTNTIVEIGRLAGSLITTDTKHSVVDADPITHSSHPEPDEGSNGMAVHEEKPIGFNIIPLDSSQAQNDNPEIATTPTTDRFAPLAMTPQEIDQLRDYSELYPDMLFIPWQNKWYRKTERIASRICGEWPLDNGESFIAAELIQSSFGAMHVSGVRAMGVDIARSGNDQTVFAFFDGNHQLPFESFFGKDLMRTANRIAQLYNEGWTLITLDDTGVGGGVTDRLRELGIPCHAVNFAHAPKRFLRFKDVANARAEMYFVLENELRNGQIALLNDRELRQELTAFQLKTTPTGAYLLEEKQAITQRLGRSPDKADATALARYGLRLARYATRKLLI